MAERNNHANLFAPFTHVWREFLRAVAFILVFTSGLLSADLSQASSPNYRRLFWDVATITIIHLALTLFYFLKVRHWTRWCAVSLSIIILAFVAEMTFRVWL